jgi:hypothetical protein
VALQWHASTMRETPSIGCGQMIDLSSISKTSESTQPRSMVDLPHRHRSATVVCRNCERTTVIREDGLSLLASLIHSKLARSPRNTDSEKAKDSGHTPRAGPAWITLQGLQAR